MNEQQVKEAEFLMFKKELIAQIEALPIDGKVFLTIDSDKKEYCANCGKVHQGLRSMAKASSPEDFIAVGRLMMQKGVEQMLGIDGNKWGKPKEN